MRDPKLHSRYIDGRTLKAYYCIEPNCNNDFICKFCGKSQIKKKGDDK